MTEISFIPRPSQQKILETLLNSDGPIRLGISAVPGSGKTHILSYLASELIQYLADEQEVLIVTLVNAAVDNFRHRVDDFVRNKGLLPGFNYRVCTLHSLAHEIVRQRPALAGLSQDFGIMDEYTAQSILREVVNNWLEENPDLFQAYLKAENNLQTRLKKDLPALALNIAQSFIKRAKDYRLLPYPLADTYRQRGENLPLALFGMDIYRDYQNRLVRTEDVDFDDLIRLAIQAIELDPDFLDRLRQQWPYILEDEAQDSSLLQQQILDRLAGQSGTWVRVGDPNQAIYETFTTADPEHLRNFLKQDDVITLPMPESGRSSASIIALANHLIDWTRQEHPHPAATTALDLPHIEPSPPGDPQTNPSDRPDQIHLRSEKYLPHQEIQAIVRSVKQWLAQNPDKTVAVLDARNKRGIDIANALRRAGVPYVELLSSTAATRSAAGVLGNVLKYLTRPEDSKQLATLFRVWQRHDWDLEDRRSIFEEIDRALQNCTHLEEYLWPRPGQDWLAELGMTEFANAPSTSFSSDASGELNGESVDEPAEESEQKSATEIAFELLIEFRTLVRRWQEAAILPIDQLILLLAQDLFDKPSELALSHKFAVVLRRTALDNPSHRLPQFVEILAEISRNERRFFGFDENVMGFDPPQGQVTVSTMHRAKGLEWDRVYLMGLNNYSFPSGQPQDTYFSEKWFIRDSLNLEAEALAQLETLRHTADYVEGEATEQARAALVKERLRLFFVGLTRAKQELVVTWNRGQQKPNKPDNQPAIPFVALQTWWQKKDEG